MCGSSIGSKFFFPKGSVYTYDQCAALGCNIRPRQPRYRLQTKLLEKDVGHESDLQGI